MYGKYYSLLYARKQAKIGNIISKNRMPDLKKVIKFTMHA
jgi:hypothetical protein|tara:strand:+ start:912 stop:1031 length:120 start_codon:yes stop_codon:yes gene_type:complete